MTAPKRRVPGQFVELTRRTTQRAFYLRPGRDSRNLLGYMYAKAANDKNQRACVASFPSTHGHVAQTDLTGQRSEFMQQFYSNVARKRNLQLNRRGHFWANGAPGDMVALELEDIVQRVLYVCLQPVAAGLVERAEEWTGFQILPRDWGKTLRYRRPDTCGDDMPEYVEIVPMPPPGFEDKPLPQVIRFFERRIRELENGYKRARKVPVRGIAYCEAVSPFQTPKTPAPMGDLNPRFTSSNKRRVVEALQAQRQFRQVYRASLGAFRNGQRDVLFPSGTLKMAHIVGVSCEAISTNDPHETRTDWTPTLINQWRRLFGSR